MDNNIIKAIARSLATDSVTLRFDYRGVGNSQIKLPTGLSVFDYWDQIEQSRDYKDAMDDIAAADELLRNIAKLPMAVVGYSFGAVTGIQFGLARPQVNLMIGISPPWRRVTFDFLSDCRKPALLLTAKNDFLYSAEEIASARSRAAPQVNIHILESGDHFFRGEENSICQKVASYIHSTLPVGRKETLYAT